MVIGANQCQYLLITDSTLKWLKHEMENDITEIVIIILSTVISYDVLNITFYQWNSNDMQISYNLYLKITKKFKPIVFFVIFLFVKFTGSIIWLHTWLIDRPLKMYKHISAKNFG